MLKNESTSIKLRKERPALRDPPELIHGRTTRFPTILHLHRFRSQSRVLGCRGHTCRVRTPLVGTRAIRLRADIVMGVVFIHADELALLQLSAFLTTATGTFEAATLRTIHGEREEVLWLGEVGDLAAACFDDEEAEADGAGDEGEEEDDVEDCLPFFCAAGCVANHL